AGVAVGVELCVTRELERARLEMEPGSTEVVENIRQELCSLRASLTFDDRVLIRPIAGADEFHLILLVSGYKLPPAACQQPRRDGIVRLPNVLLRRELAFLCHRERRELLDDMRTSVVFENYQNEPRGRTQSC